MNRNTNAHFSELPSIEIERSTFDRSFSHKFSGIVGDVIPIFYDDILPGDTVVMDTSKVVRFQTLLTPMMDNLYADVYWFFVPNRLVWEHWINFMGENTASAWVPQTEYSIPQLVVPPASEETPNNNKVGTILDYLGFPVGMSEQTDDISINALPIRGYCKIMNDWFRDENLTDPINIPTGDSSRTATTSASYVSDLPSGGVPFKAAKFADYFTSALPSPQKGNPVGIDLSIQSANSVPVLPSATANSTSTRRPLIWFDSGTGVSDPYSYGRYGAFAKTGGGAAPGIELSTQFSTFSGAYNAATANQIEFPVNLTANLGLAALAASFTVNDLRYAFQLQKLLERDARGGSRYIEVIKAHFNVDSPDQRLQRPEYLGGNRFPVQVNQVSNTAQSEQDFLGDLGAFSVTSDVHSDFTKSFTEHGMLFGLMVIRSDKTYSQMLEKFWRRKTRFDYYWPVFSNIGEQPIKKSEIFGAVADTSSDTTFGYQEAWADYRYKPNRVSAEMRPYVPNGLYSWTLADSYSAAPSLSDSWIREDSANVDRVLAVTSEVAHQFWCDVYFNFKHTRPMPVYSIPGLIDHH